MRIKERSNNRLVIENKSINWVGIVACISIFAALIYRILTSIQEKSFSTFFLVFVVVSIAILLFGLAITLSVEFVSIDKKLQQIAIVSQVFSIKKITTLAWSDIVDIEVAKTNTSEDDVGSARYEIYACLASGKKIELGRSTSEKNSRNMAEQVRTFVNFA